MPLPYKIAITSLATLLIGASIFRTMGWYIHDIYWAQQHLGGDKFTHVIAGMLIMHTSQLWLNSPLRAKCLWLSTGGIVLALYLEELSQRLLSNRVFSYEDFLAGISGVAVVLLFSLWYLWLRPQIPNRTLK